MPQRPRRRSTHRRLPIAAILALCLASQALAQRTWFVRASGGNPDFTDLPPAVAAAAPGDTIVVFGVAGARYAPTTVSRGIGIIGIPSGQPFAFAPLVAQLTICGIPPNESARVSGLSILSPGPGPALHLADCDGAVALDLMTHTASQREWTRIERCRQVSIRGSTLQARETANQILDSRVVFTDCQVGSLTASSTSPAGIRVVRSDVDFVGSTVEAQTVSFLPRIVLRLEESSVRLSAGSSLNTGPFAGPQIQGVCGVRGSTVVAPPGHGLRALGCATLVDAWVPGITMGIPNRGSTLSWSVRGTPGSVHVVFAGPQLNGPLALAFGNLWIQPWGPPEFIGWAVPDATGQAQGVLGLLPQGTPRGSGLALQSIELDPRVGGGGALGTPAVGVVR